MALNPQQQKWLADVSAVATQASEVATKRAQKDRKVDEVQLKLAAMKASIGKGQDYQVEKDGKTLKSKAQADKAGLLDSGASKAMNEIDVTELAGSKGLSAEQVKIVHEAQAKVVALAKELREGMDGILTEDEFNQIATREIWTPLVREGVIPENAVPDRFSEFKQMFDAANKLYAERLAKHTADKKKNEDTIARLGDAKFLTGKMADLGSAVAKAVPGQDARTAALVIGTFKAVSEGGFDLATGVLKADGNAIVDAVVAVVAGALAPAGGDIAKAVSAGFKGLANSGQIGAALAKDPPDFAGALDRLGKALASSFEAADSAAGCGGALAAIGSHAGSAMSAAQSVEKLRQAGLKGDPKAVLEALGEIAGAALKKTRELQGADSDQADSGESGGKGVGAAAGSLAELLKGKDVAAIKKALETEAIKHEIDALSKDDAAFQQMLALGLKIPGSEGEKAQNDAAAEMASIEALVAQLQRDRMILDTLEKLAGGAAAVIDAFVVGIGVASAVEFAANAIKAVNRARELNEWVDNLQDAQRAGSVYDEAFMNRVRNSRVQLTQDMERAAVALTKFIADTAAKSGIGAGAAVIVKTTATVVGAAADAAWKVYSIVEAERAWNEYQAALANPANRKKAREALVANATLSKYAIVYGALVAKDAVMVNAMTKLGLNEKVLANPGTNAAKCAQFLETRFRDDPVILKAVPQKLSWYTGPVELTLAAWLAMRQAAETAAEPKLKVAPSGVLDAALLDVQKAQQQIGGKPEARIPAALEEQRADALTRLIAALDAYRPVDVTGKPHELATHVATLRAQAEQRLREARGRLAQWHADRDDAVGELATHVAAVEGCQHTDAYFDLLAVQDDARRCIERVQASPRLLDEPLVTSHLKQLEAKLAPLARLLEKQTPPTRARSGANAPRPNA